MVRFVEDQKILVYMHNGGKFDYHYVLPWINTDEKIMLINGRLAKFKIGECEFRDSMNIIPVALDKYQKEKIDYSLFEPDMRCDPRHWEAIKLYLRSDCLNLATLVEEFYKRYGSNLTQAGASMNYWSREFGIEKPRQTAMQYEKYKDFYYGGRVQCFREGHARTPFKVWDINSAYPYAMLASHPFSVEAMEEDRLPPVGELEQCMVRVEGVSKGAFPLRVGEQLFFPEDEHTVREYFVTGWELAAALETDTFKITHVNAAHRFPLTVDFRDYIMHFYDARKEAKAKKDKVGDLFAKWFMNSLYGKFGSNPEKYSEYVIATDDTYTKWLDEGYYESRTMPSHDGTRYLMERKLPEDAHRYYNIATAASVTGYVRAHLWKAALKCEGLIYCDTDSIAAEHAVGIPLGNELGQWKAEGDFDEYAIAGKKLYAFHKAGQPYAYDPKAEPDNRTWKIACKGVDFHKQIDGPKHIIRAAHGEKVIYSPEVPTYSLKRGEPCFVPREVTKTFKDIRKVPHVDQAHA